MRELFRWARRRYVTVANVIIFVGLAIWHGVPFHSRKKQRCYSVAYSDSPSEYKIIYFNSLRGLLAFWWKVWRHPHIKNVRWEIQ